MTDHFPAAAEAVLAEDDEWEPPLVAMGSFTTVAVPGTLPPVEWDT